jgi:hypothetical protein
MFYVLTSKNMEDFMNEQSQNEQQNLILQKRVDEVLALPENNEFKRIIEQSMEIPIGSNVEQAIAQKIVTDSESKAKLIKAICEHPYFMGSALIFLVIFGINIAIQSANTPE